MIPGGERGTLVGKTGQDRSESMCLDMLDSETAVGGEEVEQNEKRAAIDGG